MQQQASFGLIGNMAVIPTTKIKYVLYSRKSTESEERQILSIDSQIKEMLSLAERENLEIIDIRRESHSAKESGQRPVFKEILEDIRIGRYNGVLTWAPDRLSRNAGDLGSLVDLMDQRKLIHIQTYGQTFSNSPNEKFLLMILCSQAKLENDNKSINVKRGLRARVEMGLWPAPAPTGYLNEKRIDRKGYVMIDPERGPVMKQMFEKVAYEKWSGRKVYHWLKFEMNLRSATSNKPLTLSNIYRLLQTPFFYGVFEYPMGSGKWYQGKHIPLITREVFEKAREQLKRSEIKYPDKQFAFSRIMTCGRCESGVTAEDKYKKLAGGGVAHYVYYGCNRSRNLQCKEGYIREEEVIRQLVSVIEELEMNEGVIKKKFDEEYKRMAKFQKSFLSAYDNTTIEKDFDAKRYAGHVLNQGSIEEKRELLSCLKSSLILENKLIKIKNGVV